jgi:hypothetical protein
MKEFVLIIFLIVFGCKLIDVQGIIYKTTGIYTSIDSQLAMPSEELQTESDEQKKNKLEEEDVFFFLPARDCCILISASLHKTNFYYCKPLSGFTTQLFIPPNSI